MISIIIPSLNSPHIKRIVEILKKERANFKDRDMEIIIVGKDESGLLSPFLARGAGGDGVIFIDTGRTLPPAASRNIGLKLAHGNVIIFLDSDCIPQNGWIGYLLKAHKEGKEVVGGAIDFKTGNFWQICDNIIHFYNSHSSRRKEIVEDGPLPTANLSISREAVDKVGLFSEGLITGEDFEYSMRLRESGYMLNFERKARVLHLTSRATFSEILKHSMAWAKNSIYLRKRFCHLLDTPFFMKNGFLLYLFSPLLAGLATFKIFFTSHALLRYWYTVPVIYFAKLVWSITASQELLT